MKPLMFSDKKIITTIGHLQIFSKVTRTHPLGKEGVYYYRDLRFPVEMGPFNEISKALRHWKTVLDMARSNFKKGNLDFIEGDPKVEIDNVIYVDFKSKRRLG